MKAPGQATAAWVWLADAACGETIADDRRSVVWRQTLPDGRRVVCKFYRRKPPRLAERIALALGLYRSRAEREHAALAHLQRAGIACSVPLGWSMGPAQAGGRADLLVTAEVQAAVDLRLWLRRHPGQVPPAFPALFELVAAAHHSGLMHGALFCRNVLLGPQGYALIDLPRSQRYTGSVAGRAPAQFDLRLLLQELLRSVDEPVLVQALQAYGPLPQPATAMVAAARTRPLGSRAQQLRLAALRLWRPWWPELRNHLPLRPAAS